MPYVQLSSWNREIKVGEDFAIEVQCNDERQSMGPNGYAINFQTGRGEDDGIIFHFCPRAPSCTVVLNTLQNNKKWDSEVRIIDDNVKRDYFMKPYKLKIKVIDHKTVLVYVNNEFKTEYICRDKNITGTKYIVFSPFITIDKL